MGLWADAVLHVLLPRACMSCRDDMPMRDQSPLCASCAKALPPALTPACARCGGFLGARRDFCGACAGKLFACRIIRARSVHRASAAALVHAFKFRGFPSAACEAGRLMAERFEHIPELSGFDAFVAIPLHPRRLRERGYNQAELIARELAARTGLPLLDPLERVRGAGPAWSLGRAARHHQLAGAFRLRDAAKPFVAGKRLLLVDDVCASSTTLEECALVLRRSGAKDIVGYVFTRAGRSS